MEWQSAGPAGFTRHLYGDQGVQLAALVPTSPLCTRWRLYCQGKRLQIFDAVDDTHALAVADLTLAALTEDLPCNG